jgi:hypothetical protein
MKDKQTNNSEENSKKTNYSQQGKKNRAAGRRFEIKVREDLEKMGWIVDKWTNTVDYNKWKLVKVKNRFLGPGKPQMLGAGFPDFIAFKIDKENSKELPLVRGFCEKCKKESFGYDIAKGFIACNSCNEKLTSIPLNQSKIIGVEVKSQGHLDKIERDMCHWLLNNKIFSKILIAKKGEKRGEIEYIDFLEKYKKDIPLQ